MKHRVALLLPSLRSRWLCTSCMWQQQRNQSRRISILVRQSDWRPTCRDTQLWWQAVQSQRAFLSLSLRLRETANGQRQAVPLGDFYTELLSTPIPQKTPKDTSLPTFVQSGDKSREERAKLLFGTIEGSGYERRNTDTPDSTWRTINGVPVPPRPNEPDNCCMSGCVHCVWDDYRDDLEAWAGRIAEAQAKSPKQRAPGGVPKVEMPRSEVHEASNSMDDDGGGSEGSMDYTLSLCSLMKTCSSVAFPLASGEFMATEKRIKGSETLKEGEKSIGRGTYSLETLDFVMAKDLYQSHED